MTDEKLKEIKDSIDFQERITKEHDFDMTMLQEEIDLYNEVIKLQQENKELNNILTEFEKWLKEETKKDTYSLYEFNLKQGKKQCLDKLQELKQKNDN